jgi:hypothetical protein
MFWEVDLRPHDKHKHFSSKDTGPGGSANPANLRLIVGAVALTIDQEKLGMIK